MPIRYTSKGVYLFGVIVYSKIFVDRFHACMKIWTHKSAKEAPWDEQNKLRCSGEH